MTGNAKAPKFQVSSGNVFRDLGVPEPDQELVKTGLVKAICSLVAEKRRPQVEVAAELGLSQPKVSLLLRGRTDGFSTDMLMRLLNRLGQSINIVVAPTRPSRRVGATQVSYRGVPLVSARAARFGGSRPSTSAVAGLRTVTAAKKSIRVHVTKKK